MNITIRQIKKKDYNTARQFAIEGTHLTRYVSNKVELYFYSKYFWYNEISKATRTIGAYLDGELAGVLLVAIKNKPPVYSSLWSKVFIHFMNFIMKIGYKSSSDIYNEANSELLRNFCKHNNPDGELNFFAVNPKLKGRGIGTLILNELAEKEKGRLIYVLSDSGATYLFYQSRGFTEAGRKDIVLRANKREIHLRCYLFSKLF